MKTLPKTHTQKLYVCATPQLFPEPGYEVSLLTFDPTAGNNPVGHILLGATEVTVDVPDRNPVQAEIEAIQKARDNILASAQLQATQLNERIQRLLCIEHEVSP